MHKYTFYGDKYEFSSEHTDRYIALDNLRDEVVRRYGDTTFYIGKYGKRMGLVCAMSQNPRHPFGVIRKV